MKEKQPQFLKDFTKEESKDERIETARAIKEKRKKGRERQSMEIGLSEKAMEQLKKTEELEVKIEKISSTLPGKILNFLELRKLRSEVAIGKKTYEDLKEELKKSQFRKRSDEFDVHIDGQEPSTEPIFEKVPNELMEAKEILSNFYKDQKEKWADAEYSEEDIEKYFSEEHLSSLSVDDYALLLQRFSGKMVTHVTRQGIRDHTGMVYHLSGTGKYANGFMKVVDDGRLRSPLGIHLVEREKEKVLQEYLLLEYFETKKDALEYLDGIIKPEYQGSPGSYVDKMAVHFATEKVADKLYGSEKGNEIFFAYPSEYISSQYYFEGQLDSENATDLQRNDQWVWANEERGVALNAGVTFISEEARVDKKTGSRYKLDQNNEPIENEDYKKLAKDFVESEEFMDLAKEVIDKIFHIRTEEERSEIKKPFTKILKDKFGMQDERLQNAMLDFATLQECVNIKRKQINNEPGDSTHTIDGAIEKALGNQGIFYEESKDTISSKEFWEEYFAKNPDKKPNKIVYYKGQDPTKALNEWRNKKGIDHTKGKKTGLTKGLVSRSSEQATSGMDRFKSLAEKVIDDYYNKA